MFFVSLQLQVIQNIIFVIEQARRMGIGGYGFSGNDGVKLLHFVMKFLWFLQQYANSEFGITAGLMVS